MKATTLQELINLIKLEDTTEYIKLINTINSEKLERYEIQNILINMPNDTINKFTDNQLELLKFIPFRKGQYINFYMYGALATSQFGLRFNAISSNVPRTIQFNLLTDDLIYMSDYYKTKWRKANPSKRNAKGTQFTFKMDMFSLMLFKKSITKGFLRTEAKNFILKVNEAFNASDKSPAAVKIRNKFYAIILDNTEVHTNAMLSAIQPTTLQTNTRSATPTYYNPDPDEALCVRINWLNTSLISFNTPSSSSTYANDIPLVTHTKGTPDKRMNLRLASAMSVLLTLHAKTGNETYYNLSKRMASNIDKDVVKEVIELTTSVTNLNNILKELNE